MYEPVRVAVGASAVPEGPSLIVPMFLLHVSVNVLALAAKSASEGRPSALATHVPLHEVLLLTLPRQ